MFLIGWLLFGLGFCSGIMLFIRAAFGPNTDEKKSAVPVLAGLFISGISIGMLIIAAKW